MLKPVSIFFLSLLSVVLILVLMFPRLKFPREVIFDEHYFVDTVRALRDHGEYRYLGKYTTHPPHGTIAASLSVSLLGDNSVGWRAMPLAMHLILMILIIWLAVLVFSSFAVGLLSAILFSLDGIAFGQATTLFFNTPMLVFLLLSLICAIYALRTPERPKLDILLTSCGVMQGVAGGFRLPAFFYILMILPIVASIAWKLPMLKDCCWVLCLFFCGLITGYVAPMFLLQLWGAWGAFSIVDFHRDTILAVYNLKCDHRYNSPWWTWPLLIRPVWYYFVPPSPYQSTPMIQGIISLGNPVLSALVPLAILKFAYDWVSGKNLFSSILLLSALAMWLPWALIDANTYIHYWYPTLPFTTLLVGSVLVGMFKRNMFGKVAVFLLLSSIIGVFCFFYPLYVGKTISEASWKSMMWLSSWV